MDPYKKASREYLITLLTSIKKVRRELQEQRDLHHTWRRRIELARDKGRPGLQKEAEKKQEEILAALEHLENEEKKLLEEFREAQTRYDIEQSVPDRNVDPDLLLEHLTGITGETDTLQEESSRLSVDKELEELKRKMKGEQG